MKSLLKVILLISISFSFVLATADGPDYWRVAGVSANDVLWMHPTPDYHSGKIGKIPHNAICLKNLECTGNISFAEYQRLSPREQDQLKNKSKWCKVDYRGTVGWVNAKFLTEGGNCP